MARRTRYRLDRVNVKAGEERASTWTFGGEAISGTEQTYSVRDDNFPSRNQWEFLVRTPSGRDGRVEVRPRTTPNVKVWAELTDRSLTFLRAQNNDRAVDVTVTFSRVLRGDVIVSVQARGTDRRDGVRIVSERRPQLGDDTYLLPIAFGRGGTLRCRGLTGTWDPDAETVALRMPSRCLERGNYGAVRFAVLTEQAGPGGADVDWAPEDATGEIDSTAYIPRG